jgi:hypothetical protein
MFARLPADAGSRRMHPAQRGQGVQLSSRSNFSIRAMLVP